MEDRGPTGPKWHGEFNEIHTLRDPIFTNYTTSASPSIVNYNSKLHLFFRDGTGNGILHAEMDENTLKWYSANPFYFKQTSSNSPCPVIVNDVLHIFYRDGEGNGILFTHSYDGNNFTYDGYVGQNGDGHPSAAVLHSGRDAILCVVYRDHDGKGVMYSTRNQIDLKWHNGYTGQNTNDSPAIVVFNNQFHVYYKDGSGNGILHETSTDGIHWQAANPLYIGFNTSSGVAAIATNSKVYVFYRDGSGNGCLYVSSSDGYKFESQTYTGLNLDQDPSVAILGHDVYVAGRDHGGRGVMVNCPFSI